MLVDFKPRLYQETILAKATQKNTLVVLPTGLGKTAVAFLLSAQRLSQYPQSKIVFLAPTKPLAEQHLKVFKKHLNLDDSKFVLFTGSVAPQKRVLLWDDAQIIIGTPQGFENDVMGSRISLEKVSLIIFDEAHHATGDYSYCFIAKQFMKNAKFPRILGLTASPGSDLERVREVCSNLFIDAVEVRTLQDPDVVSYVKKIDTNWVEVDLPESFKEIQKLLVGSYQNKLVQVKHYGYVNSLSLRKTELLQLQGKLHGEIAKGARDIELLRSVSLLAQAMKVQHAIELLETQGIPPLSSYFEKIDIEARNSKSKAAKNLASDSLFKAASIKAIRLFENNIKHPKLVKLIDIVEEEVRKGIDKIIVFSQYRDSAKTISEALSKIPGADARIFVGQAKKKSTGMSQKKQKEMLDAFRNSEFNILVCTSVGEEGLDIPAVDLVIFFEPIPSAIRHIQRRGRTGRSAIGRVIGLVTKDTRDSAYRWVAHHKEKRMYRTLEKLKKEFVLQKHQKPLTSFIKKDQTIQIVVDYREKGSDVMKQLIDSGASLKLEKLDSADYICSADCGIEFKTVEDFVQSIIDGRFVEQLKNLKTNFKKPLVIIQGDQDMYAIRKIHPNAIRGMLATIAVSFGIPIIQTRNAKETASFLEVIARREQDKTRDFSLHTKKPLTIKEQQEYIVSSLPSVGLKMAQQLLNHFSSVEKIACASVEQLREVDGIGTVLADRIKSVFSKEYEKK